jgi:hypothetical protein
MMSARNGHSGCQDGHIRLMCVTSMGYLNSLDGMHVSPYSTPPVTMSLVNKNTNCVFCDAVVITVPF